MRKKRKTHTERHYEAFKKALHITLYTMPAVTTLTIFLDERDLLPLACHISDACMQRAFLLATKQQVCPSFPI